MSPATAPRHSVDRATSSDATPAPPIRVMVCDDSATIRLALARILESEPGIAVVARLGHGRAAVDAVRTIRPEVIVLDIEMPVMDGLTALPLLLEIDPRLRVIVASSLTKRGAAVAMQALRLGAADYVPKPGTADIAGEAFRHELVAKVRGEGLLRRRAVSGLNGAPQPAPTAAQPSPRACRRGADDVAQTEATGSSSSSGPFALVHRDPNLVARPSGLRATGPVERTQPAADSLIPALRPAPFERPAILAIGSSTGGPQALFTLMTALGRRFPLPIVITQHMPAAFIPSLAAHIDALAGPACAPARTGDALSPGLALVAPGDTHLLVEAGPGGPRVRLSDEPAENFCRPAVDPMLRSASEAVGGRVLVVMLTGMGRDGLEGTRAVVVAGGAAIAQDEASSVVWGMPGAIARAGLCHLVLPLDAIAAAVRGLAAGPSR